MERAATVLLPLVRGRRRAMQFILSPAAAVSDPFYSAGKGRRRTESKTRQQIWLRTQDPAYEEKLRHFLTYHYGNRLDVHRYEEYREGLHPAGNSLILTDAVMEDGEFGRVIPLTLGEAPGAINLYQSGHRIAQQIFEEEDVGRAPCLPGPVGAAEPEKKEEKRASLIAVYSPVGGSGKTTLAMALAECISRETGGRVLYLNLEGGAAWRLFYRHEKTLNLSDLLYSMLLDPEQKEKQAQLLEQVLSRQENGVYFIEPCTSFEDLNLLSPGEVTQLLNLLSIGCDWMVCDMNTAFHSVNRLFLQEAQRCLTVIGEEREDREKLRDFFRSLEVYEEVFRMLKEKTRLLRRGRQRGRGEEADSFLPEEKELYHKREGLLQFNRDSAYYQRVQEIAREEVQRAGSRQGLSVL